MDLKPETVTKTPGNLEVEMKAMPSILTEGNSMVLTLTLKNVSDEKDEDKKGNPIHISTDLTKAGWTVQEGSAWSTNSYTVTDSTTGNKIDYNSQNLEPKESVVLTKTITSRPADGTVQVEIEGYDIYAGKLPTYTYDAGKSNKQAGEPFTETEEQGTVKSAQNLAAGALIGRNEGTIQEIRQNLTILQADRKEMDNQPELKAGGIAGEVAAGSQIENVYLTGTVKFRRWGRDRTGSRKRNGKRNRKPYKSHCTGSLIRSGSGKRSYSDRCKDWSRGKTGGYMEQLLDRFFLL